MHECKLVDDGGGVMICMHERKSNEQRSEHFFNCVRFRLDHVFSLSRRGTQTRQFEWKENGNYVVCNHSI